jgi:hypothetical protein
LDVPVLSRKEEVEEVESLDGGAVLRENNRLGGAVGGRSAGRSGRTERRPGGGECYAGGLWLRTIGDGDKKLWLWDWGFFCEREKLREEVRQSVRKEERENDIIEELHK